MSKQTQQIPLEGASRVTIDVSGSDLAVNWSENVDSIIVSGREFDLERAGDEIFLRAERRTRGGGLFGKLPNISAPGVKIDWGDGGNSIEVSDDEGVIVRTGRERRKGSADSSAISLELPIAITVTSIEVEQGDLALSDPSGKVDSQVKTGNLRSSGGNAVMSAALGSGDATVSGLAGSLDFMGGSGNVEITECQAAVSVKAGSGEVTLASVKGEAIDVMAGSGDVELRDCAASECSCQTGSGDSEILGGTLDKVSVRSGSGDVECSTVFGPYSQSFTTGSGSVSLGVPRGLPARFEVATQGGDIDSDVQLVSVGQRGPRSRKTRRQVGSIGTGEPRAEVSVRTSSGDIRLYWLSAIAQPAITFPSPPEPPSPPDPPTPPRAQGLPGTPPDPDPAESPSGETGETRASDPRQEILEALAAGVITVEEADDLLEKIEKNSSR